MYEYFKVKMTHCLALAKVYLVIARENCRKLVQVASVMTELRVISSIKSLLYDQLSCLHSPRFRLVISKELNYLLLRTSNYNRTLSV